MSKKESKVKKLSYQELENYAKRIQADFENLKKRTEVDRARYIGFANTDLILQILPIMDNFHLAVKHLPKDLEENSWVAGIRHIENQLEQVLASEGVTKINTIGKQFDTNLHEATGEAESKKPPGTILEETRAGYQLNDKVIRHSRVVVAGKQQQTESENIKEEKDS
jgi:molecular chaperone GrpE